MRRFFAGDGDFKRYRDFSPTTQSCGELVGLRQISEKHSAQPTPPKSAEYTKHEEWMIESPGDGPKKNPGRKFTENYGHPQRISDLGQNAANQMEKRQDVYPMRIEQHSQETIHALRYPFSRLNSSSSHPAYRNAPRNTPKLGMTATGVHTQNEKRHCESSSVYGQQSAGRSSHFYIFRGYCC